MDLKKIARLARLKLSESEEQEFRPQIEAILSHVQSLQLADAVSGEALSPARSEGALSTGMPLREDEPGTGLQTEGGQALVELSPGQMNGYFEVPQVVSQ
jgi:aspartyl-tRNA(Asn)/glutamyl-tRNA(Gln) amidotransferase subunit C